MHSEVTTSYTLAILSQVKGNGLELLQSSESTVRSKKSTNSKFTLKNLLHVSGYFLFSFQLTLKAQRCLLGFNWVQKGYDIIQVNSFNILKIHPFPLLYFSNIFYLLQHSNIVPRIQLFLQNIVPISGHSMFARALQSLQHMHMRKLDRMFILI